MRWEHQSHQSTACTSGPDWDNHSTSRYVELSAKNIISFSSRVWHHTLASASADLWKSSPTAGSLPQRSCKRWEALQKTCCWLLPVKAPPVPVTRFWKMLQVNQNLKQLQCGVTVNPRNHMILPYAKITAKPLKCCYTYCFCSNFTLNWISFVY